MAISRRMLGTEHPETLLFMNNLADAYTGQGKYAQADALLSGALEIERRALGPEHSITGLAENYAVQVPTGQRRRHPELPQRIANISEQVSHSIPF
jgi:hypothetical protein